MYVSDGSPVASLMGPRLQATDSDLSVFAQQGGKLLHYVGWADEIISPGGSIHYYDSVKNFMSSGGTNIDDFYRLFTVPGMEHW